MREKGKSERARERRTEETRQTYICLFPSIVSVLPYSDRIFLLPFLSFPFGAQRLGAGWGPFCKARNGFLFSDVNISSTRAHSARNKSPYTTQLARLAWEKERKKGPSASVIRSMARLEEDATVRESSRLRVRTRRLAGTWIRSALNRRLSTRSRGNSKFPRPILSKQSITPRGQSHFI